MRCCHIKTEVMPVGIKSCLNKISEHSNELDGLTIEFKKCIKYLGVYLDPTLSMKNHISNVCRVCFLEIRRIASIKKILEQGGSNSTSCYNSIISS